jgi:predicted ATPase
MAFPGARLLQLKKDGMTEITLEETEHFQLMREFCENPKEFVESARETDIKSKR